LLDNGARAPDLLDLGGVLARPQRGEKLAGGLESDPVRLQSRRAGEDDVVLLDADGLEAGERLEELRDPVRGGVVRDAREGLRSVRDLPFVEPGDDDRAA